MTPSGYSALVPLAFGSGLRELRSKRKNEETSAMMIAPRRACAASRSAAGMSGGR